MNWIKSNPFASVLAGITIVICAALYFLTSKAATQYEEAKSAFDESFQAVSVSESLPLYPTNENRDGKRKAISEYRDSIAGLDKLFDGYRPGQIENVTSQVFTDRLKAASEETTKALGKAGSELPEGFFMGFESYRTQLAQSDATGVLLYQLNGIKHALLELAKARPSKLIRVYRDSLPEENGDAYKGDPNDATRDFGFEVTFKGSEAAAREFISSLGATEPNYYVVRCVKIQNEREAPPAVSDAKFESTAAAVAQPANNPFEDFTFPTEDGTAEEEPAEPEAEEPAKPAPAATEVDTSRILAQVLGNEELIVFVRFDLAMFLPTKPLPKP